MTRRPGAARHRAETQDRTAREGASAPRGRSDASGQTQVPRKEERSGAAVRPGTITVNENAGHVRQRTVSPALGGMRWGGRSRFATRKPRLKEVNIAVSPASGGQSACSPAHARPHTQAPSTLGRRDETGGAPWPALLAIAVTFKRFTLHVPVKTFACEEIAHFDGMPGADGTCGVTGGGPPGPRVSHQPSPKRPLCCPLSDRDELPSLNFLLFQCESLETIQLPRLEGLPARLTARASVLLQVVPSLRANTRPAGSGPQRPLGEERVSLRECGFFSMHTDMKAGKSRLQSTCPLFASSSPYDRTGHKLRRAQRGRGSGEPAAARVPPDCAPHHASALSHAASHGPR